MSWLRAIGISVNLQYMDEGAMNDKLYNTVGDVFTPDMDLYIYNWTGDVDPTFMLSIFLTDQINAWSDCAWSSTAYDQLFEQQLTSLDTKQRQGIIWQMQQIAYRESPRTSRSVYPKGLEVVNTSRWDGWVQSPGSGSAIYSVDNIDSYLFVHPRAHEKSGGSPVGVLSIIVAAVVLVALGVVWLLLRKRPRAEEQAS